jgi:hypothetical protein
MQNLGQMISPRPYLSHLAAAAAQEERPAADSEAPKETLSERLHRQTYVCLRTAMAFIAFLLPIVFFVSAYCVGMKDSISAFYHGSVS